MASTTALFTGLSGMNVNSRNIDVIGNNIANVNTTAYKSNRLMFSTVFSRTQSIGTAPSDASGGTNPYQVGLGVQAAGTQRNMSGGSVSATGDGRDMAIDGAGFFVVKHGASQYYTRAGGFRQNKNNDIVDIGGNVLQGYGVDENFNIKTGQLQNMNVPIGARTQAQATSHIGFSGVLSTDGAVATRGSLLSILGATDNGLQTVAGAAPAPTPPNKIEATTRLLDLEDTADFGGGQRMFAAGERFEMSGAQKGGRQLPTASFAIADDTTVQDLADFLTAALGINTEAGANPDGGRPGVAINTSEGSLGIVGNIGADNSLTLKPENLRHLNADGGLLDTPFKPLKTHNSDGESVHTLLTAYDSLGAAVNVEVTMVLQSKTTGGTTWKYYVESDDDSDIQLQVGAGTLNFDSRGKLVNDTPLSVSIDRAGSGSASPLTIDLNFGGTEGSGVTALANRDESTLAATQRDGYPAGTLESYGVGQDGTIMGNFSNGESRLLGQVALATFANPEGLVDTGNNLFSTGGNSGAAIISGPGTFGAGGIVGGALELSNVDLGEEFIKLILSSTGYSASSRVIKTTDDLMQQLLVLGR